MQGQCGFTGTLGPVDLNDTSLGVPAAESEIKRERTGGDRFHPHPGCIPETHDRSLSEIALDLTEDEVERLVALTGAEISTGGLGGFHVGWHG